MELFSIYLHFDYTFQSKTSDS